MLLQWKQSSSNSSKESKGMVDDCVGTNLEFISYQVN